MTWHALCVLHMALINHAYLYCIQYTPFMGRPVKLDHLSLLQYRALLQLHIDFLEGLPP